MKLCHVCSAECLDDAELCPVCGAELADEETTEPAEEKIIENPVLAASVEDVVTAEIFKDILTQNNIPFSCDESENGMNVVFGGGFVAVDIYVDEDNLEKAEELYEEVLNTEPQFDDSDDFDDSED